MTNTVKIGFLNWVPAVVSMLAIGFTCLGISRDWGVMSTKIDAVVVTSLQIHAELLVATQERADLRVASEGFRHDIEVIRSDLTSIKQGQR